MPSRPAANPPPNTTRSDDIPDWYPSYVLSVLVVVYVLNFLDRQILSILNEHIKADLGLTDAQMGFLFGTAFAVFYALFGIPLGRLADVWTRRSLIALGLAFWSAMTALSGLAQNFTQIAAARIGVGIGEASASPAAYSLLSDWFAPRRRATVLAIYSSGIYIGAGCGLMIGGQIVDRWDAAFAPGSAPYGLRGWQVAFFAVGLPGLALAAWVRTLREPVRGEAAARESAASRPPLAEFLHELQAVLPPLTLWTVARESGAAGLRRNVAGAAVITVIAWLLTTWSGDAAQWGALAVGTYAAMSWMQSLQRRNPEAAQVILGTATLRWAALGFGFLSFTGYAVGYWGAPYFMRVHSVSASEVGFVVGGVAAAAGWLGVTAGGALADAWRARSIRGRLYTGMLTAVLTPPLLAAMLAAPTGMAFVLNAPLTFVSSAWIGAGIATVHDLVPARLRGTAGAAYLLVITFIGLALGPYLVGKFSAVFGSLGSALMAGALIGDTLALIFLLAAARSLPADQSRADELAARLP